MDDILKSIKDAQRNALMERAWKVAHEEMQRAGLSDTTIASGHIMAAMTLWQRELRKRGAAHRFPHSGEPGHQAGVVA
jgi:hypothetical protein